MGHLINPSAMRIGWFRYWEDLWFIDFVYYPEFLHLIFKIKLFLLYFFGFRFLEFAGFLYNDFVIIKKFKLILIKIYFINNLIDELIDNFLEDSEECINTKKEVWTSLKNVRNVKLFLIISFISKFDARLFGEINIDTFITIFRFSSYENFKNIIFTQSVQSKVKKVRFLFFCYIIRKIKESGFGANIICKRILKIFFFEWKYKFLFFEIGNFLSILLLNLFNIFDNFFKFDFILIRNQDVNAKFLSRYIARKLQQGFYLKKLSYSLCKELNRVSKIINSFYAKVNIKYNYALKYKLKNENLNTTLKSLFLRLLNFLLNIYKLECCKFYKINYCWLNFDSFILFYWIFFKFNFLEEKIGISFFYMQYKGGFSLFFNNDCFLMSNFFLSNYIRINKIIPFKNIRNLEFSYDFIYISLYTFNFLFFNYFVGFIKNVPLLKVSMYAFFKFLKYKLYICDYFVITILKKSFLKLKENLKPGFFGFKFHFKGRFSRRQRASSVVYSLGKMPLTKLNANIEYGFYTIPLKNSAISVKVWVYRNKLPEEIDIVKLI